MFCRHGRGQPRRTGRDVGKSGHADEWRDGLGALSLGDGRHQPLLQRDARGTRRRDDSRPHGYNNAISHYIEARESYHGLLDLDDTAQDPRHG